jgi:hypothetical protein
MRPHLPEHVFIEKLINSKQIVVFKIDGDRSR